MMQIRNPFLWTNIFPNAIYHIVKSFYHTHEHHETDEDSLLTAYTSPDPIAIKDPDNKALVHYLQLYDEEIPRLLQTKYPHYTLKFNVIAKIRTANQRHIRRAGEVSTDCVKKPSANPSIAIP